MEKDYKQTNNDINTPPPKLLPYFSSGIFKENQVFIYFLGLCPALGTTTSLEGGFGMGILTFLTLILTNVTISLLKKFIPSQARLPIYIIIIATQVTIISLLTEAFAFNLFFTLGTFIPLITVNCIIFGRAESFASKNNVFKSFLDAIGVGLGVVIAFSSLGFIREFFGTGNLTFGALLPLGLSEPLVIHIIPTIYTIPLFVHPAGAFILLGLILALITSIKLSKSKRKEVVV